ncbi:MAG: hypothetical protein V3U76_03915 [Granulosicoccus sp.]
MNSFAISCVLVMLPLLIAGCHSNDDDSNEPDAEAGLSTETTGESDGDTQLTGNEISAIAGLWDYSELAPQDGEEDVAYLLIESDGSSDNAGLFTVADYDQDAAGNGGNCYYTLSLPLTPLGENQYRLDLPASDPVEERIMTMTKNGNVLTISYLDEEDQNANGETTDIFTKDHAELTGIDTAFEPCAMRH